MPTAYGPGFRRSRAEAIQRSNVRSVNSAASAPPLTVTTGPTSIPTICDAHRCGYHGALRRLSRSRDNPPAL